MNMVCLGHLDGSEAWPYLFRSAEGDLYEDCACGCDSIQGIAEPGSVILTQDPGVQVGDNSDFDSGHRRRHLTRNRSGGQGAGVRGVVTGHRRQADCQVRDGPRQWPGVVQRRSE